MDEDLISELMEIVNPEPDDDNSVSPEWPPPDLKSVHGLDAESYFRENGWFYEGSTMHKHSHVRGDNEVLELLSRSLGVPSDLFVSGLRVLADSLVARENATEREGDFHYYPPSILTFWAGFECFVRYASTLMVETVRDVTEDVADMLLERKKYYPVLARFEALLRYGYGYQANKGDNWWQRLVQAQDLRDHFTHIRVDTPRDVSSDEVLDFMDAVLIGLIRPSCDLQRSLMPGQYRLYKAARYLRSQNEKFVERPFFLKWNMKGLHGFHCNFENVDNDQFPVGTDHERLRNL